MKQIYKFFSKNTPNKEVFIIAEIGKNFIQTEDEKSQAEYLENAKKLIDEAIKSGADAVKFQTHVVEDEQLNIDIISPHFKGSDRYSWVKRNTKITSGNFWQEIKEYCDKRNIIFFSTPMSKKAAEILNRVDVPLWKIGSGDVLDFSLLDFCGKTEKPIIISTGMVSLKELDSVLNFLKKYKSPVGVLYCVSEYPCKPEKFNLSTIEYLKDKYPSIVVGFSDHSIGNDAVFSAIKLGAQIIEKHFSLDRNLWGSDHKVSQTPKELEEMVNNIRSGNILSNSLFYGNKNRELAGGNNKFRPYFNKILVAAEDIKKGTLIEDHMIYSMRPQIDKKAIRSEKFFEIIGKRINRDIKKYEPLYIEYLN